MPVHGAENVVALLLLLLLTTIRCTAKCIHVYDLAVKQRIVRPVLQLPFGDAGGGSSGTHASGINVLTLNAQVGQIMVAVACLAVVQASCVLLVNTQCHNSFH